MEENMSLIFLFQRSGFHWGRRKFEIWELDDCMLFKSQLFPKSHDMKEYNFTMPKTAIKGLVRVLQKIPRWKRTYRNDSILDGEVWKIKFVYGEMIIDTTGINAYPFGFKLVVNKIQNELEKLCKEYADDYSRKEFKKHKLYESL